MAKPKLTTNLFSCRLSQQFPERRRRLRCSTATPHRARARGVIGAALVILILENHSYPASPLQSNELNFTMNIQALLLVAASMTARASAEFTVTSAATEAATSTSENVAFVKQWTLSAANSADAIDSIDLDLAGRVYVSYVSGLPSGVLGYVNVSGDSQTVVNAVTVTNDDTNDNDADDTNDTDGELNVRIGNSTSTATTLSGYLLTEIFLASAGVVTDVKSQRSAQVVVEDGVLVSNGTTAELQVEASGSSAVYVSAASTDVSARQLHLEAAGTSKLQFIVDSVSVTELDLETQGTGTICISAQQVTATTYEGKDASRISMPNASNKHDSTGSLTCDETSVPAREPSCVSTACASSSTAGTAGSTTGNVDSNASSTTRLAALAAAMIGAAAASLL